jgi:hypothetical protein
MAINIFLTFLFLLLFILFLLSHFESSVLLLKNQITKKTQYHTNW